MASKKVAHLLGAVGRSSALSCMIVASGFADAGELKSASRDSARAHYPANAPSLVEQALAAGVQGNVDQRAALLKQATDADGDFAPARWQQGQLMFDGKWRTPADVAAHVAADQRWKEYETLRAEAGETPQDHVELAQWCQRNELKAEERYHWANVLLANPAHQQARQRLGLQQFQGGLYTREQIAAEKERRAQAERDLVRFKPKFAAWCREATSNLKATRDQALSNIRQINDPAAIPALREAVARTIETADGKRHRPEIVLAMTGALSNMPQHVATLHLLELAVFSSIPEVRQAAAEALRPRPTTDYVPLLMAALQAPIEADVDVVTAPDGTVRMVETVTQQQPLRKVAEVRSTDYEVEGAFGRDKIRTNMGAVLNRHLRSASSRAVSTQSRVEAANAMAQQRNERIQQVLKITLGAEVAAEDATAWWEAWKSYNELNYDESVTDYQATFNDTFTHAYEQAPRMSVSTRRAGEGASTARQPAREVFTARGGAGGTFGGGGMMECFAAGTLVWKQSGPTPIEQIRVGDMVLAKHPTTGELAYRPVLEATFSASAPVVRVKLPEEEFIATRGHRFWVEGTGWLMAKELPAAASLHTLSGGLDVASVEPADEVDCYNLVVDEFHTFVIGKSQVLVHDKTCPEPTIAVTPGLADAKHKREPVRAATEFLSATAPSP
jgi:tetratricopeptide (TPR) repeat protein